MARNPTNPERADITSALEKRALCQQETLTDCGVLILIGKTDDVDKAVRR